MLTDLIKVYGKDKIKFYLEHIFLAHEEAHITDLMEGNSRIGQENLNELWEYLINKKPVNYNNYTFKFKNNIRLKNIIKETKLWGVYNKDNKLIKTIKADNLGQAKYLFFDMKSTPGEYIVIKPGASYKKQFRVEYKDSEGNENFVITKGYNFLDIKENFNKEIFEIIEIYEVGV